MRGEKRTTGEAASPHRREGRPLMSDPILKSLGIKSKNGLSADAFDVLVGHLAMFARGGGTITWNVWKRLRSDTKAGLVAAFERVRAEDAALIGIASQGPRQAARVLSPSDGGDLDCELCLDDFVDNLTRKQKRVS